MIKAALEMKSETDCPSVSWAVCEKKNNLKHEKNPFIWFLSELWKGVVSFNIN